MRDLVSVVVPTYNRDKYIEPCVRRIINQDYCNIEVIIVDDGSTDDTRAICERLAFEDKRIRYCRKKHSGVSATRNMGIDVSSGKYITFVDIDDSIEDNLISSYLDCIFCLNKQSISLVLTSMLWENRTSKKQKTQVYSICSEDEFTLLEKRRIIEICEKKLFSFVTNKFYLLETIKNNNIRFNPQMNIAEDIVFNLDYIKAMDGCIGYIKAPLYHYVKHNDDSLTGGYFTGSIENVKFAFDYLIDYVSTILGTDISKIKAMYLTDWISRLTAMYDDKSIAISRREKVEIGKREICSEEFVNLLEQVKSKRDYNRFKLFLLERKWFSLFCIFRKLYKRVKKVDI